MLTLKHLIKNKKDYSIIFILISVITFVFFVGNNTIADINNNIRHAFIESITGDIILEKINDVPMNLFGVNTPVIDRYFSIPTLPAYNTIIDLLSSETGIDKITSQVSGNAYLDLLGVREPVLLCGIDADTYFTLFPGIVLKEGRFLLSGEYGAMITSERAIRIEAQSGVYPQIDMPLLFTFANTLGFKIREVPLVGIFSYQNPGTFMNDIVIIDPQTVRILNSIKVAGTSNVNLEENIIQLMNANPDDIFDDAFEEYFTSDYEIEETEFSVDLLQNYLRENSDDKRIEETGGDWNFIILKLKNEISSNNFISSINKKLKQYNITSVNWRTAAGISAIFPLLIQALFNSGIFLVCVVGIISIINILMVSVFRRIREIGTLRAIGASDFYIRSLIYSENLIIALFGGFTGVFFGFLFIKWVNNLNLNITNNIIITLMGGIPLVQFKILPNLTFISSFLALVLGFIASIYPVETAVRIQPMEAVRRG